MNPGDLLDAPDDLIAAMVAVLADEAIAHDRASMRRHKAS